MAKILVFGASLTFGAWDIEGGWVQRLRRFLDKENITNIPNFTLLYNLGVSGNTTEDLLERFEFETKQRLKDCEKEEQFTLIFGVGGNDSARIQNKNDFWIPPEKFKENIEKLIELAKKYASRIIFVGLVPVDDSRTNPPIFASDIFYKTENIKKYNEILKSTCKEKEVYFIEVFEEFIKMDYKKLLEDGLHPNSEGHKKIFEIVRGFLTQHKMI